MAPLLLVPVLALVLAACSDAGASLASVDAECIATPESAAAIAKGIAVQGGGTLGDAR